MPPELPPPVVNFGQDRRQVGEEFAAEAAAAAVARARAEVEVELQRSRVEYERWRIAEEASFAKLLREKVRTVHGQKGNQQLSF